MSLVFAGISHIVQEYIDAPVLADLWNKTSLDEQYAMPQLQGYLGRLCALSAPEPGKVQAVDGIGMSG